MTLIVVVVVALCAHRLARAVALDGITDPARDWVYRRAFTQPEAKPWPTGAQDESDARLEGWEPAPPALRKSQGWAWVYGLVSCPHCVGFWLSLASYAVWVHADSARPYVVAVAVAGAQSVLAAKGVE